ncbi:hypothetical protein [Streptomyces sp. NPDC002550]
MRERPVGDHGRPARPAGTGGRHLPDVYDEPGDGLTTLGTTTP